MPIGVILLGPSESGLVLPVKQVRAGTKIAVAGSGGHLGVNAHPVWQGGGFCIFFIVTNVRNTLDQLLIRYCRHLASKLPRTSVKSPRCKPCCSLYLTQKKYGNFMRRYYSSLPSQYMPYFLPTGFKRKAPLIKINLIIPIAYFPTYLGTIGSHEFECLKRCTMCR